MEIGQEVLVLVGAFKTDVGFIARMDPDGTYAVVIKRIRRLVEGYQPEELLPLEP